jgi:hypothetical protein
MRAKYLKKRIHAFKPSASLSIGSLIAVHVAMLSMARKVVSPFAFLLTRWIFQALQQSRVQILGASCRVSLAVFDIPDMGARNV